MTPLNLLVLIGRMTADPELQSMPNGKSKIRFTLAIRRNFKNSSGEYDSDFINCESFGVLADLICKFCRKGSEILVQGNWRTGNYKDKNGNTVYTNIANVSSISFSSEKREFKPSEPRGAANNAIDISEFEDIMAEDPPF